MAKKKRPEDKTKSPTGRPTIYTEELGQRICNVISASNFGLRKICEDPAFPAYVTVTHWLMKEGHPFIRQYTRAKEQQADYLADEMMEIADECPPLKFHVDKAKLQVDTRKWIASKLKVRKYGDNVDKYIDPKDDAAAKTTKETLADKIGKITGLIAKKKKISGEEK